MKLLPFKNPRLLFALAGFILFCNYTTAQTINSSWVVNTYSPSVGDTSSTEYRSLAFTVNLSNLDEMESFSLLVTDEKDNTVTNVGEYIMKKHENGFYYVEEKNSHDKRTVLGNTVYFSSDIPPDKVSKIKMTSLKVKSKAKGGSGSKNEKTIKTKVPKIKNK